MLPDEWKRIVMEFGITVRKLRSLVGWSQQNLADKAVISQGAISRIESGRCKALPFHSVVIVMHTLAAAVKELGITIAPTEQALLAFVDQSFASPSVDPDIVRLVRTVNCLNPKQREAFMNLLRPLVELLTVSMEAQTDDSSGLLLRQHQALPVRIYEPRPGRRSERIP